MIRHNNKWLVVMGAIIVQMCIGTIYSWSLFNFPLMEAHNWTESEVVRTYQIATFVFAFSTIISGKLQDRYGPRFVASIGGILYGGGLILASTASTLGELYVFYGVISGLGVGFVYVCPISATVKWFPNKKGFIVGIAIGAFGSGSLIFKFIIKALLDSQDVFSTFLLLGFIYMVLILIGAQFVINPKIQKNQELDNHKVDLSVKQMIQTRNFYILWFLFFLGCMSGLYIIGLALDIGVKLADLSIDQAANIVVIIAFFNASGRILWGRLSDHIGRLRVLVYLFTITGIALAFLSFVATSAIVYYATISMIVFCFGGFLAVFPIITEEFFGKRYHGSNYGVMYQAYGLAAIAGLVVTTFEINFRVTFLVLLIVSIIGFLGALSFSKLNQQELLNESL